MTIPLSPEAINHLKGGGTSRTFPKKLTLIPSTGQPGIYFLVEGKRGGRKNMARSIIHFVLAKEAHVRPHPWLLPSLDEYWPTMLQTLGAK